MNIENIDLTIASIKGEIEHTKSLGFNMNYFIKEADIESEAGDHSHRNCGTIACIAGHAFAAMTKDETPEEIEKSCHPLAGRYWTIPDEARDWLELTHYQAECLFYAKGGPGNVELYPLEKLQPEHAIKVLEHLKATGNVEWSVIGEIS